MGKRRYQTSIEDFVKACGLPPPRPYDVGRPSYDPEPWNIVRFVGFSNCYGYALNMKGWLKPGFMKIHEKPPTISPLFNQCVSDGLIPAPLNDPPDIDGYYLVALVNDGNWHWYRKDDNGLWSHKPGSCDVTNLDDAGQIITNPETAVRTYNVSGEINYFYKPC